MDVRSNFLHYWHLGGFFVFLLLNLNLLYFIHDVNDEKTVQSTAVKELMMILSYGRK